MLRFVVALIAVTTYGYASSVEECRYGESYWCSSLENAKACGAFEHCKSTVWKNQILKADDSEVCDFCKSLMEDVRNFVKDNRTERDIQHFMKTACGVIPIKSLATECSMLVDTFLQQILEMIVNNMKPRPLCSLIKLCVGFEDSVAHSQLSEDPLVVQAQPIANTEPICADCKKFFTDLKDLALNNATEDKIEVLIDLALCSHLGAYEAACKFLVKSYLPEIVKLLTTEIDPNIVCQIFCTANLGEVKAFLVNLKLKHSKLYKTASADTSNDAEEDGCSICKVVVKDIQDLDRNAAVQKTIKDFLELEICARLGSYKDTCTNLIEMYSVYAFELLANELDPESRCRSLGFCASGNDIRDPTRESTPLKTPATGQGVSDSPECTLCKFVVEKVDDLLKQNFTRQEVIAALDKICSFMPEAMRDPCLSFVNQYGPFIFDLLVKELDPNLVCSTLGLCSEKSRTLPSKVSSNFKSLKNSIGNDIRDPTRESTPLKTPATGQGVSDSPECTLCKFVVEKVDDLLKQNATKQEVIAALDKICSYMPEAMRDSCLSFVNQYGPFIFDLLVKELDPNLVCSTLGLCSEKPRTLPSKVSTTAECLVCEAAVEYVRALVKENATTAEIKAVLMKFCNFVPETIRPECDFVVKTYGILIIKYISTASTPKAICELVGACKEKIARPDEIPEANIVKNSNQLLGASECSLGPKYWCTSRENARECQATDYCDQTGWDL